MSEIYSRYVKDSDDMLNLRKYCRLRSHICNYKNVFRVKIGVYREVIV